MFYCQATSATKFSSLKMLEVDGMYQEWCASRVA